ncbi:MAG: hypothetical protein N2560_09975 [Ignavibacteria bacterium]|nr:hypothetical protein [Ignavibacteria bacterium]
MNLVYFSRCNSFFIVVIKIFFFFLFLSFELSTLFSNEYDWGNATNIREINSAKDDFAPQWNKFERRLYFASNRKGTAKFYVSNFDNNFNFSTPKEIQDPINRTTRNVSYLSFISETEAILNAFRKGAVQAYLNIFYTQRRLGTWQKPIPLDSLQCECFVLHPTISPDGSFLIFSSNRNDFGQLDLYVAYKDENGIWGNVEKIEELSTDGDEITPFLASNDTLYFASNGFGGPGGFDIFYSVRRENYWDKPIPLSRLNTRFDESDFAIINDSLAVFASDNPEGLGGLDLYLAKRTFQVEQVGEYIPRIDLSISVQIPIIRVQQELEYELAQFPQVVPFEFIIGNTVWGVVNDSLVPSVEFLKKHYLSLLLTRIAKLKVEVVFLYDTLNQHLHETILKAINSFSKEYPFIWELVKIENNGLGSFSVQSKKEELFVPVKIGIIKENYEPPVLDITINARPESLIKFVQYQIRKTEIRRIADRVPISTSLELISDSLVSIRNSDSIFIDLIAEDTAKRRFLTSYPIILNRSSVKYKSSILFRGKKYERIYLFETHIDGVIRSDYSMLFNEIMEYTENIRELVLIGDILGKNKILEEYFQKLALKANLPPNKVITLSKSPDYEKSFGIVPKGTIILLIERK